MIPDFQTVMRPLLQYLADGKEKSLRDSIDTLADQFGLTKNERTELLPSGHQPVFHNRIGWARTYLKNAGLVESTRRGHFRITERGRRILQSNPERVDVRVLEQFPEFCRFRSSRKTREPGQPESASETPEESLASAYQVLRDDLASELLAQVKASPPYMFESIVLDLLVALGYGGSLREAARRVGRTGDEGVDGIINEDALGLDIVAVQAKRWENSVGRPEVQGFAGALQGQRARKGVFITTSTFTEGAQEYVRRIDSRIVLIDGPMLAQLMIDNNIGVSVVRSYEVKRVDTDYFSGE